MRSLLWSVAALILSFSLLLAGNSLQFVILGLRAGTEGFSIEAMGLITAAYFAGFAIGSFWCPRLVGAIGHIRTFAALASVVSGMVLAHTLWVAPLPWAAIRLVTGFCFAGLYMVAESWLNARANNQLRGRLLSIYAICAFGGYACGPLLANLAPSDGFELFVIASILVSFALVPVTVTRASAPVTTPTDDQERYSLARLYRETPLGAVGSVCVGAGQGAFLGLGPVFGDQLGLPAQQISLFMTATMVTGLVFQYPLGWAMDRGDRRLAMVVLALSGGLACGAFGLAALASPPGPLLLFAGAVVTGLSIFPLYAVVLAHTNDWIPETSLVQAAAALLLAYSLGSALGAPIASAMMAHIGPGALYLFLAATLGFLGGFTIFRRLRRGAAPVAAESDYAMPLASPGTVPLDPTPQDDQLALDFDQPAA